MPDKAEEDGCTTWAPGIHVGDLAVGTRTWLQPGPGADGIDIWGVDQHSRDLSLILCCSLSLYLLSKQQTKLYKIIKE